MRPMSDKIFLDSNILIYGYSNSEPAKQLIARQLIAENNSVISTQILQEVTNTVTRKFEFSFADAAVGIEECCQNNILHINTEDTIVQACGIAERYGFSLYDSLVISAALESDCKFLYSEDLQHNQTIEKRLTIINPFI